MLSKDEFRTWLEEFNSVFPDAAAYFARDKVNHAAIMAAWLEILKWSDLRDLRAITANMLAGRLPELAKHQIHTAPRVFAREARRLSGARADRERPTFADGQKTFSCLTCHDRGMVLIWSSRTMRAILSDQADAETGAGFSTSSVTCDCERGRYQADQLRSAPKGDPGPTFNGRFMLTVPEDGEYCKASRYALVEWVFATFPDLQRVRR